MAHGIERRLFEDADRLGADDRELADRAVGVDDELQVHPAIDAAPPGVEGKLRLHVVRAGHGARADIAGALRLILSGADGGFHACDARRVGARGTGFGEPAARERIVLRAQRAARFIEHAGVECGARELRRRVVRIGLQQLRQVELGAVGGGVGDPSCGEALVEAECETRQRVGLAAGALPLCLGTQCRDVGPLRARRGGRGRPAVRLVRVAGAERLARLGLQARDEFLRRLLHPRIAGGERARRFDEEARALCGRVDELPVQQRLAAAPDSLRHALVDLLLRELLARLLDDGRLTPAARGVLERREGAGDVAGGGGVVRLVEHQAFALRADLRQEERHARVLGADGVRRVRELLRILQVSLLQRAFRVRHQSVDGLLEALRGARIARVAAQGLAVQVRGARPGRRHQLTGGQCAVGSRQQSLEGRIRGGGGAPRGGRRRAQRCRGSVQADPQEWCGQRRQARGEQPPFRAPRDARGERRGRACGAAGPFGMAPPGRLDEQPHALLGDGLVQETMHRAVGDLGRESHLVLGAARHDEHDVRELRVQPRRQLPGGGGERGDIQDHDPGVMCHQCTGEIDLGAGGVHLVRGVGDLPEGLDELAVLGQGQELLADEGERRRDARGWRSGRTLRFGVGSHGCQNLKPARWARRPAAGITMT